MWDECNCAVVGDSLALPFFGIGMKTDLFQSCGHCWVFQICWHIERSTFIASSFRIWNNSTGIPSPPLALFIVMLSKAHLTSHSRMSGSTMWWSDHTIVIIFIVKIFFGQDYVTLNIFCTDKETKTKMKRQHTEWDSEEKVKSLSCVRLLRPRRL